MQQIKPTLRLFLTSSPITLCSIILLMVAFFSLQTFVLDNQATAVKVNSMVVYTNAVISLFVGIYFGTCLLKLKQHQLWTINKKYRFILSLSFFIMLGIFSTCQAVLMSLNIQTTNLVLLLPFCIATISSYLILGDNYRTQILVPLILLPLNMLINQGVSHILLMVILLLITFALAYNIFENKIIKIKPTKKVVFEDKNTTAPQLSMKLNFWLGNKFNKNLYRNKGDITNAISLPYFKFFMIPVFHVLFIMLCSYFVGKEIQLFEILSASMMAVTLLSLVLESRQLSPQLHGIAHLFGGANHRGLKQKILYSMDKSILINSFVYALSLLVCVNLFNFEFDYLYVFSILSITLVIMLALYPLMIILKWGTMGFQNAMVLILFGGSIFLCSFYITSDLSSLNTIYRFIFFVLGMVVVRFIARMKFFKVPIEKLLVPSLY